MKKSHHYQTDVFVGTALVDMYAKCDMYPPPPPSYKTNNIPFPPLHQIKKKKKKAKRKRKKEKGNLKHFDKHNEESTVHQRL